MTDLTGTSARVRASKPDGVWGPWYEAETLESDGRSATSLGHGPRGTDPVFVGLTTTVQIAVTRPADAPVTTAPQPATGTGRTASATSRPMPNSRWRRTSPRC